MILSQNNDSWYFATGEADEVYALGGSDVVYVWDGDDLVYGGEANDFVDGGNGHDYLSGGLGDDAVIAGAGNDWLAGGGGDEGASVPNAPDGNDVLDGGAGADLLDGDGGDDRLIGGSEGDIFRFFADEGHDIVMDFTQGQDVINLSEGLGHLGIGFAGLDTNASGGLDDGDLAVTVGYGNTWIDFSVYGSASSVLVVGQENLSAGDFV